MNKCERVVVCSSCWWFCAAEELECFRRYFASLFAVPATGGSAEPQTTALEGCLTIEVLDEVRDVLIVSIPQHCPASPGVLGQTPQSCPPLPVSHSFFLQKSTDFAAAQTINMSKM